jgi:hypothetical protein
MALDEDARAVSDECRRIKGDRLEPGDFERIQDELGVDEEEWQRLCELLEGSGAEEDDEDLLENWRTVKEEIIGGRIYGFVRANFPELSHELLVAADFRLGPETVSAAEENGLAGLPFTFNANLADELVHRIRLFASDSTALERELRGTLRRERLRRITRPVRRALAYIGIVLLLTVLWKLLT